MTMNVNKNVSQILFSPLMRGTSKVNSTTASSLGTLKNTYTHTHISLVYIWVGVPRKGLTQQAWLFDPAHSKKGLVLCWHLGEDLWVLGISCLPRVVYFMSEALGHTVSVWPLGHSDWAANVSHSPSTCLHNWSPVKVLDSKAWMRLPGWQHSKLVPSVFWTLSYPPFPFADSDL